MRSRGSGGGTLALLLSAALLAPPVRATADEEAEPGHTVIPIPIFFYTPETETGFGASVIWFFRLSEDAPPDRPSSLAPVLIYTMKEQVIANLEADLHLRGGAWRLVTEIGGVRFPNTFWGIGNETPDSNEEDFTPRAYTGLLRLQRQIAPAWFAGITASFAYRELEEVEPEGLLDLGLVGGTEDGRVAGIGLVVTRDTRDRSVYPRAGGYQELEIRVHEAALGSDWSYTSLSSDLKAYVSVRESQVLALQAVGTVQSAAPPFDLLPQIGGDSLLRGYFGGRWRDRALLAFQAEYRVPVKWRIGAVAFAGVGQVAHDADGFRLDGFRASGGAGLRFLLSPEEGFQLRADWGAGDGSSGFYLAFGEAF